ncbi:PREDICTED: uncharacterized protein LOC104610543 [Nelumbo nucifera]|uniref:RING-type E3 ubiquitin transferase n=2 Tax=Nelumbo nucifera TaxID=4432 RepID=A0A1U8BFE0_NELNU|nr:PREDICTED: uncharacterized protein LOC104610543 [Nelumbo nucifera]DAD22276.1 TPA_asm: hypothetical protein HUJ06_023739 [Nelumbo nucifera]
MGTGWRRAFCTSIPRDPDNTVATEKQQRGPSPSPSPRSCTKFGLFLSGGSNPSTPRLHSKSISSTPRFQSNPSTPRLQSQPVSTPSLRCRTTAPATVPAPSSHDTPRLQCNTTTATTKSPGLFHASDASSPRSPSRFALFKSSLRLSRNGCGICLQSVKSGQRTAIFTAECSHAFHFPCIASHVKKHGSLVCPVCNANWREVPLLAVHKNLQSTDEDVVDNKQDKTHGAVNKLQEKRRESITPRDVKTKYNQQSKPSDSRVYDDDEPLLSPTAGARFVPIPEADENEGEEENDVDDEIDEFQGFFVNPIRSSSYKETDETAINTGVLRNVEVRMLPEAAVVSVDRSHETYVVALKLKAPPSSARNSNTTSALLDPGRRAPIDLVTVLDVSGSMTGAKLQMLKRAMRLVISSLGSSDRLSIVAFSASPKRLMPLRRMTASGQRSARRIIDRLVCGQGTSVSDALRKATKVLEDRRERNPVASIMLLSDGQDERISNNSANRRCPTSSNVSSTRFAHLEIPVHAFGFGENGGRHSHDHEPAEDAFTKCVGGLLSVVVQDLRIQLGFCPGSAPAEISAVYNCSGRPTVFRSGSVRLGDLYAEEERELLVELKVPAAAAVGATHHVMSVRCSYRDPATQELINGKEHALLIPRPQAIRSSSPKIERLRNFYVSTRALVEARRLVERNELSSAYNMLSSVRALMMQSTSSICADEYLRSLEAELAELHWQLQIQRRSGGPGGRGTTEREAIYVDENGEPLTPSSAWRAAERLAKVAIMKKSLNRVSDLHGFENARF